MREGEKKVMELMLVDYGAQFIREVYNGVKISKNEKFESCYV